MQSILFKADIFTGDASRPGAEAVLIEGNRIKAVGSIEDVHAAATGRVRVIDLPGRLITPGLVDGHTHFSRCSRTYIAVDLAGLTSIETCRRSVQAATREKRPGEWIIGWGWDHHAWEEKRDPLASDLDDITPENPTILYRMCGHSIWVNTIALKMAGINAQTPDPAGGCIVRLDSIGNPSGWMKECDHLIKAHIPPLTLEQRKIAVLDAQNKALQKGLTGVHSLEGLSEYAAMADLDRENRLKLRVHHTLPPEDLDPALARGIRPGASTSRLWFQQIKMFTDGSLGSGTALLHEPYSDEPDQYGIEFTTPAQLHEYVRAAYSAGCDVAIHAIGDKALANALNTLESERKGPASAYRDRVEHAQLFTPDDLKRMADLKITASVQPVHLFTDWHVADRRWGPRCSRAYAYKSILNGGIHLQMGSDAPVMDLDPILGLYAAVTRQDLKGRPEGGWHPEECLTLPEVLTAFTAQPAFTARKEALLGSITPGKLADLTIFSRNLFAAPPEEWPEVDIEMTVVDGEIVYRREGGIQR